MKVGTVNALYGSSDPKPAENTWTYVNRNFKRTILRKVVDSIGIDAFLGTDSSIDEAIAQADLDADAAACDGHLQNQNGKRFNKLKLYFKVEDNFGRIGWFA